MRFFTKLSSILGLVSYGSSDRNLLGFVGFCGGTRAVAVRACDSQFCAGTHATRAGRWAVPIRALRATGERPCDVLDTCCMVHDHCDDAHHDDYLNTKCNEHLLSCIDRVNPAGPTFPGNSCNVGQTASVIKGVVETTVRAVKILRKRDDGR
ncbi:hypothetical protein GUJ93_ZPchr0006g43291 [Zizania palustris]|uniref:Phospholipase A2 domain-containing protein n=1 Tax=Zizania palustris TaxID=103762 RepID=A0A8J5VWA2_ZIZPA|nr:hypothetical protein GUJ93_ZPchr0006g43291 [Zizania palustris]